MFGELVIPGQARNDEFRTFHESIKHDKLVKSPHAVIPAKAGIQNVLELLDSWSSPE